MRVRRNDPLTLARMCVGCYPSLHHTSSTSSSGCAVPVYITYESTKGYLMFAPGYIIGIWWYPYSSCALERLKTRKILSHNRDFFTSTFGVDVQLQFFILLPPLSTGYFTIGCYSYTYIWKLVWHATMGTDFFLGQISYQVMIPCTWYVTNCEKTSLSLLRPSQAPLCRKSYQQLQAPKTAFFFHENKTGMMTATLIMIQLLIASQDQSPWA